jgi:hypothetical protein
MKKILLFILPVLMSSALFAQTTKTATTVKSETETATTTGHECYMMKDQTLVHCMGPTSNTQKTEVKLTNGTRIYPTGVVLTADGKKSQLANGECVDMSGNIGDCEKMHASLKQDEHMHK